MTQRKKNMAHKRSVPVASKNVSSPAQRIKKYREKMKAAGFKEIRRWVPDVDAPGFDEECRRQAESLKTDPQEKEALDFIEQAADWGERVPDSDENITALKGIVSIASSVSVEEMNQVIKRKACRP